ncbi:MAG: glutamate-1-semialdehyde 2,1-aminomutase [bacterium]
MVSISSGLFTRAQKSIPGGVNSPVRAFKSVGRDPLFIAKAKGSKIYDVDGKEYIDYVCSWGPMILGHAPTQIIRALKKAAVNGTSFGAPTKLEIELAELIINAVPSIEKIRMVNSGTEATMSAIRLARGYTGRDKILKFEGCYHGHVDALLVKAGSGIATLGIPDSLGVPASYAEKTITLPYNKLRAVEEILNEQGKDIACIIVEPVAGNMGVVPPKEGFLQGLRQLCDKDSIILIFDEVITGFRVSYGGAQELYNIHPDLTCLGKIIGGGLPVGAYGGKKEIMDYIAPVGPVYQAGTLSGNPLAMTAGIETLKILADKEIYRKLEKKAAKLAQGITENAKKLNIPIYTTRIGSLLCAFFTDKEVVDYASAKISDTTKYAKYFNSMLELGINLAPSQFEAAFISLAHSDVDIERTIEVSYQSLKRT